MNGMELSRELLMVRPGVPILLISGAQENFMVESAEAIGVDASLMKPFRTHELSSHVRHLLDSKEAQRRAQP
jgi:DNA-binding response OmpR family regulator